MYKYHSRIIENALQYTVCIICLLYINKFCRGNVQAYTQNNMKIYDQWFFFNLLQRYIFCKVQQESINIMWTFHIM